MAMIAAGMSYEKAGSRFGLTRGMVAGIIHRMRHPESGRDRRKIEVDQGLWTEERLTEKWAHRKLRRQREAANGQAAG